MQLPVLYISTDHVPANQGKVHPKPRSLSQTKVGRSDTAARQIGVSRAGRLPSETERVGHNTCK